MSFARLFWRNCVYYRKPFLGLSAAACLICAILTSALLIGDSVRGTLHDQLNRNTSFAKTVLRFSLPVTTESPNGVLHTQGYIAPGIKTHLYAFTDSPQITGRDAYCSRSLAEKLQLHEGDMFTVRVQTVMTINSENLFGVPPELKQIQLIYRGVLPDEKVDANFENPQLRADNVFLNHDFLAQSLQLPQNSVNEIWSPTDQTPLVSDGTLWELSQLDFDDWGGRPVLKSKGFFLPEQVVAASPEALRGLTTFAESFSDDENRLNYFFVGAFEGDTFPVEENRVIVSDSVPENFGPNTTLTFFATDAFRNIVRREFVFSDVDKASDVQMNAVLTPEIPGLTDATDCSHWEAGLPIDFEKIKTEDTQYWEQYKSKPKLYMNFEQAQALFFPGQCSVLIFDHGTDTRAVKQKIIERLRHNANLYQAENVFETLQNNIDNGIPFATLFLGLSFFIIVSSLLVLGMLLKLHLFDRSEETRLLTSYLTSDRKFAFYRLFELVFVLLPGMIAGLFLGVCVCKIQLFLLEHVWNDIVRMNRLAFHAEFSSYVIAFAVTLFCSLVVIVFSLRVGPRRTWFYFAKSKPPRSVFALARLSFLRRWGEHRLCMILLTLGFLGTLGVGTFGIKSRGEDAFSHDFIAETALSVIPSHEAPFPPGGLPVRVRQADSVDCSNILRAETPTVYGCDLQQLTGDPRFLGDFSAAVDAGSMQWIMKKKIGDTIAYPRGQVTLQRTMKATVFQRGILVDNATFVELFPDVQGARFFLIRGDENVEAWRTYLEPYGVSISTTDAFMAQAEAFQNRYLAIFLQLGILGFVFGIGSLLLLIVRNVHAQRSEMQLLHELGFSRRTLFGLRCLENFCLYLASAFVSLAILILLALWVRLDVPILIAGWGLLTIFGTLAILATLKLSLKNNRHKIFARKS